MADIPTFITSPVVVDDEGMQTDAYDHIREQFPDWVPNDSNLETWQIGAFVRMVSQVADLNQDVPPGIFKYLGQSILGIPPIAAASATVQSTWTFTDNPAGRTILVGTLVSIPGPDGDPVAFEVVNEVTIASPALTTAVGEVTLRSVDPGEISDGLGGVGVEVVPLDPIAWVDTVTLTGVSSGGREEETDAQYLDRLSARLTLLTLTPILPRDYEVVARDLAAQQGVDAFFLALDGYNPADNTFDNERMVTLVGKVADTGADISPTVLALIDADLQARREVNFVVNTDNPDRTTVDVTFTITSAPGFDGATAAADAVINVTDYLSPARWGLPVGPDPAGWVQADTLRRQEISTIINNTPGVDHWDTLTIGLNGGAQTAAEAFPLTGAAPLAEAGIINGSVTP